jgi:exodeoxyribonuclease-3
VKFAQKLAFLDAMKNWFDVNKPKRAILVGDLNIAPNEDDVWDHKKLSKIVSHTPLEIEKLSEVMKSGHWIDVFRKTMPDGKLYSWWSYRAKDWQLADKGRRLDHIWVSSDLSGLQFKNFIFREARGWERPSDHAPIFTVFDET